MKIRIQKTQEVVDNNVFRALHPDVSFPAVLTDEILENFGANFVYPGTSPQLNRYQFLIEDGIEKIGDKWFTKFSIANSDVNAIDAQQSQAIRDQRNIKLSESDWTQVADAPVDKTTWATYRQALRDISKQQGFPWEVTWPDAP